MVARKSGTTSRKSTKAAAKSKKPPQKKHRADYDDELPQPSLARRVGWIALFALTAFFVASLVSFNAADPPSHAAAPLNDPALNWCGPVGAFVAYHTYLMLGTGVWIIAIAVIAFLVITATGRVISQPIIRASGFVLMMLSASAIHGLVLPAIGPLPSVPGGLIGGWGIEELAGRFSGLGTFLCLAAVFLIGAIVAVDRLVLAIPVWTITGLRAVTGVRISVPKVWASIPGFGFVRADAFDDEHSESRRTRAGKRSKLGSGAMIDPDAGGLGATEAFDPDDHEYEDEDEYEDDEDGEWEYVYEEEEEVVDERRPLSKSELKKKIAMLPLRMTGGAKTIARDEDIPREPAEPNYEGYQFPALALLEDPERNYSEKMEKFVRSQAEVLEETLQTYGIDGEVKGIDSGPVITLYRVQLAPGTKVSKVSAVSRDIARSLRAQNIRIVANITGETAIGIEVPNLHKEKVRLKELMSGGHADGMGLPMFLGKDASGESLVADLTRMPHMLIAGTTGSGKSVCINSIIMSWLYTKRPDELKLVLVDPKMVELSQFQSIPHLMCPVVTEMTKAAAILAWAVTKMEERYELLREAMVRDVTGYNALSEEELYERFEPENDVERAKIPKKLPFMVFVIDELADLIMTDKEVETSIVRIAQKARAVGIHLILATQRPQANVVTGLIKSNMPCRVSFKVASGMDSRIVLDQKGAELLLGQGDMMLLTPHSPDINRAQGTLVTDTEIRKVAKFLKEVAEPSFERSLISIRSATQDEAQGIGINERDPLFADAVEIMIESGRGSVSLLQRRLAIGYSRASRLVDQMGLAGILGEHKGSVARDVMITLEEWDEMKLLEEQAEADGTLFEEEEGEAEDGNEKDDDGDLALIETLPTLAKEDAAP